MVLCVECGEENDKDQNHCTFCGYEHLIENKSINGSRNIPSGANVEWPFISWAEIRGALIIVGLLLLLFFVFINDIICFMFHGYICG
ncbi:MAG: zinc ribbon domain-containing protein [Candidatus Heimdallarchaeota archaeon]